MKLVDERAQKPVVSVLVCTYNRRDNVVPTLQSIRACGYQSFELLVLDQSSDDKTEQALREICASDARVRYVHLARPSKPVALNDGRDLARGKYLLLTDDDCEVRPGWIAAMVRAFEADTRIGCVLGDVAAGPYDPSKGYVPICRISDAHSIFELSQFLKMPGWENFGMGANMGLRMAALSAIGGWDPCIGPGAHFRSGDDHDVIARMLVAGYGVAFEPSAGAIHYGLRHWEKTGDDQVRYGVGMGAAFAKQLRVGTYHPGPLRVFSTGVVNAARGFWRGQRPLGLAFPRGWLFGLWEGLRFPLDRSTRRFVPKDAGEQDASQHVAPVVLRREQRL